MARVTCGSQLQVWGREKAGTSVGLVSVCRWPGLAFVCWLRPLSCSNSTGVPPYLIGLGHPTYWLRSDNEEKGWSQLLSLVLPNTQVQGMTFFQWWVQKAWGA